MSKLFGGVGGVGESGQHGQLAECPQLLTHVFCLHPQHYTLFIS